MIKRTTVEIDEDLLERAKRALGKRTTRSTIEVALRPVAQSFEDEQSDLALLTAVRPAADGNGVPEPG